MEGQSSLDQPPKLEFRGDDVRNNIFAFNRQSQVMPTRVEPHLSFT